MAKKKLCFVISPIGEEGSDTRKGADDLLELVVEPALEKYRFDIVRAMISWNSHRRLICM